MKKITAKSDIQAVNYDHDTFSKKLVNCLFSCPFVLVTLFA